MTKIVVSDEAARIIDELRDSFGEGDIIKEMIADAILTLTEIIELGRTLDSDIPPAAIDGLIQVMCILRRYGLLVHTLTETNDMAKFEVKAKEYVA